MGNNLGRKRQVVDEKYTKPQGLYQHKDVDHKKLRKLILDSKLAPCYPGDDEFSSCDIEECPICFLYYPSLNRSRCCTKGICTECFLQMKTPNSARPTQCPFCKTSNYAVEYRGVKTKEEKGLEQIEEQRVIEAKIRMRQQELQEEEVRNLKVREAGSASSVSEPSESDICQTAAPYLSSAADDEEIMNSHDSCPAPEIRQPLRPRHNREDDFDLGLEDIMVMEAIWLSIQENGKHQLPGSSSIISSENYATEDRGKTAGTTPIVDSTASPSGGFACAIAALAERQQMGGEASSSNRSTLSTFLVPGYSRSSSTREQELQNTPVAGSSVENSRDLNLVIPSGDGDTDWADDTSEMANARSRSGSADEYEDDVSPTGFPSQDASSGGFNPMAAGPVVPESFEEQMMLAMAVSLAEAGASTNTPGVVWH